jgi:hypothetical protein
MRSSIADPSNRQLIEAMTSPALRVALVEAIPEIQGNLSTESRITQPTRRPRPPNRTGETSLALAGLKASIVAAAQSWLYSRGCGGQGSDAWPWEVKAGNKDGSK